MPIYKYLSPIVVSSLLFGYLLCFSAFASADPATGLPHDTFTVRGTQILKNGKPAVLRGVNTLDVFGYDQKEMDTLSAWHVDIVRIVVGNMSGNPITGGTQQVGGSWLHPLADIVKAHRAAGRVVILCPFGWDNGHDPLFLGKNPSETRWFNDYLAKYREWATQFKDDPGVWFELWNEPYDWDGTHGYTEDLWLSDAQKMVDNIRIAAPNSIIVVPAGKMCGDETVVTDKGPMLLKGRMNIVFDVHAYNSWMPNSEQQIEDRIKAVRAAKCCLIFAECGATNAGYDLDPTAFLKAASVTGVSTLAWIWKQDPGDGNALLGAGDTPNQSGKYHWGEMFHDFLASSR
jgi:mannan endo-1,4-beta-mannosidase